MNIAIYSVYDERVGAHQAPFFSHNDQTAVRLVSMEMQRLESIFHAHPEDFSLYVHGVFDDQAGTIEATEKPELVLRLSEVEQMMKEIRGNGATFSNDTQLQPGAAGTDTAVNV